MPRAVSRPKFHVLSNGALVFAPCFTETVLAFKLHFQHRTQLTGKPSAPFERPYNSGQEASIFDVYCLFLCTCTYMSPAFEGKEIVLGNRHAYMRTAHPNKP